MSEREPAGKSESSEEASEAGDHSTAYDADDDFQGSSWRESEREVRHYDEREQYEEFVAGE